MTTGAVASMEEAVYTIRGAASALTEDYILLCLEVTKTGDVAM